METDITRWDALVNSKHKWWKKRNAVIAEMIQDGMCVIDVGAGKQWLKKLIPNTSEYLPVDCVCGSEDTVVYDFNSSYPAPTLVADVVVCSGVLEYIEDVPKFLRIIKSWGNRAILSYAVMANEDVEHRTNVHGWFNHFSDEELRAMFEKIGFTVQSTRAWKEQIIYELISND